MAREASPLALASHLRAAHSLYAQRPADHGAPQNSSTVSVGGAVAAAAKRQSSCARSASQRSDRESWPILREASPSGPPDSPAHTVRTGLDRLRAVHNFCPLQCEGAVERSHDAPTTASASVAEAAPGEVGMSGRPSWPSIGCEGSQLAAERSRHRSSLKWRRSSADLAEPDGPTITPTPPSPTGPSAAAAASSASRSGRVGNPGRAKKWAPSKAVSKKLSHMRVAASTSTVDRSTVRPAASGTFSLSGSNSNGGGAAAQQVLLAIGSPNPQCIGLAAPGLAEGRARPRPAGSISTVTAGPAPAVVFRRTCTARCRPVPSLPASSMTSQSGWSQCAAAVWLAVTRPPRLAARSCLPSAAAQTAAVSRSRGAPKSSRASGSCPAAATSGRAARRRGARFSRSVRTVVAEECGLLYVICVCVCFGEGLCRSHRSAAVGVPGPPGKPGRSIVCGGAGTTAGQSSAQSRRASASPPPALRGHEREYFLCAAARAVL